MDWIRLFGNWAQESIFFGIIAEWFWHILSIDDCLWTTDQIDLISQTTCQSSYKQSRQWTFVKPPLKKYVLVPGSPAQLAACVKFEHVWSFSFFPHVLEATDPWYGGFVKVTYQPCH